MKEQENRMCFLITPIGEEGTARRRDSDYLLNEIVRPAVEECGFSVLRGDHSRSFEQIDKDVRMRIEESAFCIANISEISNANVFYELGYADALGRPVIFISDQANVRLPVDIQSRRYMVIHADAPELTRQELKEWIAILKKNDFQATGDFAIHGIRTEAVVGEEELPPADEGSKLYFPKDNSAEERFLLAMSTGDLRLIDEHLEILEKKYQTRRCRRRKWKFLREYVMPAARLGSAKAEALMMQYEEEVWKNKRVGCCKVRLADKLDYFKVLVEILERKDEKDSKEFVEHLNKLMGWMLDAAELWELEWKLLQKDVSYQGITAGLDGTVTTEEELADDIADIHRLNARICAKLFDVQGMYPHLAMAVVYTHKAILISNSYNWVDRLRAVEWHLQMIGSRQFNNLKDAESDICGALRDWYLCNRMFAEIASAVADSLKVALIYAEEIFEIKDEGDTAGELFALRERLTAKEDSPIAICEEALALLGVSMSSVEDWKKKITAEIKQRQRNAEARRKKARKERLITNLICAAVSLVVLVGFGVYVYNAWQAQKAAAFRFVPTGCAIVAEDAPLYSDGSLNAPAGKSAAAGSVLQFTEVLEKGGEERDVAWLKFTVDGEEYWIPEDSVQILLEYTGVYDDDAKLCFLKKEGAWNYPEMEDLLPDYFSAKKDTPMYASVDVDGAENQLTVVPAGKILVNADIAADTEDTVYWEVDYNGVTGYVDQRDLQQLYVVGDEELPIGLWEISG